MCDGRFRKRKFLEVKCLKQNTLEGRLEQIIIGWSPYIIPRSFKVMLYTQHFVSNPNPKNRHCLKVLQPLSGSYPMSHWTKWPPRRYATADDNNDTCQPFFAGNEAARLPWPSSVLNLSYRGGTEPYYLEIRPHPLYPFPWGCKYNPGTIIWGL